MVEYISHLTYLNTYVKRIDKKNSPFLESFCEELCVLRFLLAHFHVDEFHC